MLCNTINILISVYSMTVLMNADKQTSSKRCMHLYYNHISVIDCGATFNHIYNCQNRIKHMGDVTKKSTLCPSSYPSFSADLQHG